jgi:hypothetical protein
MRINDIEYIEVEVLDVRSSSHATEAFSLILTDKFRDDRYVPIIIGLNEARAILGERHGRLPQRPLTHTLFADLLTDFIPDYNIEFVSVDEYNEGIYYASIVIQSPNGSYFNVDARPSDAVAIALHARVPIFFKKVLFEEQMQITQKSSGRQEVADYMDLYSSSKTQAPAPSSEPGTGWGAMTVAELKEILQNAIDEENYELAAKIQEEIDKRKA